MHEQMKRYLAAVLPPLCGLIVVMGLWEGAVRLFDVSLLILPPPSRIAAEFVAHFGEFVKNAIPTATEAVTGLAIGTISAIVFATVISEVHLLRRAIFPLLVAQQVVPSVVYAPILLIWLGFGLTSKIVIAAVICFFPIVINTAHGLTSVPPPMLDLARSVGAPRLKVFRKIRFPHSLPYIFTGLRPATALAMIGAIVAEFLGGSQGLGYLIVTYIRFLDVPDTFAAVLAIIVLGLALYLTVELIGLALLRWYRLSLRLSEHA